MTKTSKSEAEYLARKRHVH